MLKEKILQCVFLVACSIGSIFHCSCLITQYLSNESSTQLSIKKLNNSFKIAQPAITTCLHVGKIGISSHTDPFSMKKDEKVERFDFQRKFLPNYRYLENVVMIDYVDIKEFKGEEMPIFDVYRDSNDKCFTIDFSNSTGAMHLVMFGFKTDTLKELEGLRIFLHHQGQLITGSSQLQYVAYELNVKPFLKSRSKVNNGEIQIKHIKLIRNRADGKFKCNSNLENEDAEWMRAVTKLVGCVPPYWVNLTYFGNQSLCKSYSKLDELRRYNLIPNGSPWDDFMNRKRNKEIFETYEPPCHQMEITSTFSEKVEEKTPAGLFAIKVVFSTDTYEDVNNVRYYTAASLFAEIGGYVGIFMGISIFQSLMSTLDVCKHLMKTNTSDGTWAKLRNKESRSTNGTETEVRESNEVSATEVVNVDEEDVDFKGKVEGQYRNLRPIAPTVILGQQSPSASSGDV